MSATVKNNSPRQGRRSAATTIGAISVSLAVLALAGCRPDYEGTRVAGWSLIDPSQRHPIMVSQQPTTLSVKIGRAGTGLSPHERSRVIGFLERFKSAGIRNSRLVIEAPGGSANEVAAMHAVAEIRHLVDEVGFDPSAVSVEAYHSGRAGDAPVRLSYMRYVAEAPECGHWNTNLARSEYNLNYPNFGCANQANLAAQIANPADLIGPRGRTAGSGERSHEVWEKYIKGESTVSSKKAEESVKVGK